MAPMNSAKGARPDRQPWGLGRPPEHLPPQAAFLRSPHRLRKNLKSLIIVHPSWFIRTVLAISRPFIR